tara:strand:+ start:11472 stop:12824 length:1353 start_codon:yes stop_codon:yes gene_type:complete
VDLADGDDLIVGRGEQIKTKGGAALNLNGNNSVVLDGTIISGKNAVTVAPGADFVGLNVGETGLIRGFKNGIVSRSEEFDLLNQGEIFGGVKIKSDILTELGSGIVNYGTITAGEGNAITTNVETEIVNFGQILGDIRMSAEDDVYFGGEDSVAFEIRGGEGDDFYILSSMFADVIELKDGGFDTIQVEFDYEVPQNIEKLVLFGDGDITAGGNGDDNRIRGNAGDNMIYGRAGDDRLNGGAGNDVIYGNQDDDRLNGRQGNDELYGNLGNDTVNGQNGDDMLSGGRGSDVLDGGKDDDVLKGGRGADQLLGKDGDDLLLGGRGGDTVFGGAGDDIIRGGLGEDVMLGGDGEDTFVYRRKAESDTRKTDGIADFTSGQDALDFSGLSIAIDYVDIGGGFRGKAKDGTSIGTRTEDGDTIVLVDTDGDGRRDDMLIVLVGTEDVSVYDFII